MNSKKKLITLITSIALIAAIGVGATLALLSQTTGTVTNTFTVGKYETNALNIFEHKATQDKDTGSYVKGTDEVKENTYTGVLPGTTLSKDPFMTLAQNSPSSFLVIKATGLNNLPAGITADLNTNADYWKDITATVADSNANNSYYIYCPAGNNTVSYVTATALSASGITTESLFTKLTVADTFNNNGNVTSIEQLVFQGCAVQYSSNMGTDYVTSVVVNLPAGFVG